MGVRPLGIANLWRNRWVSALIEVGEVHLLLFHRSSKRTNTNQILAKASKIRELNKGLNFGTLVNEFVAHVHQSQRVGQTAAVDPPLQFKRVRRRPSHLPKDHLVRKSPGKSGRLRSSTWLHPSARRRRPRSAHQRTIAALDRNDCRLPA